MIYFIYAFALLLIAAGVYHFVNPAFYNPFMPEWFPKSLANTAGGVAEIVIGICMLIPATQKWAVFAAMALMIVFLPLHVLDLLKDRPAIGNHTIAVVRLLIQFVFVYLLWRGARGL